MGNFRPESQGTVSIAVTGTSQDLAINLKSNDIMLTNIGTQAVFFKYDGGGASVSADTPILPNTQTLFSMPYNTTAIAVIAADAGSILYVTPGSGE